MNALVAARAASFEAVAPKSLSERLKRQQSDAELSDLVDHLAAQRFRSLVEIGVASGRTSWILAGLLEPGALIIGIDPFRVNTAETRPAAIAAYGALCDAGFSAHLIMKPSGAALPEVQALLAGRALDYLHIDGSHRHDDVLADFRTYRLLVRQGGFIQFHDIATRKRGCEVWMVWPEIRAAFGSVWEFKSEDREDMGIGLVRC